MRVGRDVEGIEVAVAHFVGMRGDPRNRPLAHREEPRHGGGAVRAVLARDEEEVRGEDAARLSARAKAVEVVPRFAPTLDGAVAGHEEGLRAIPG
jgi:hypothetical protein